jgi:hypothetical protein
MQRTHGIAFGSYDDPFKRTRYSFQDDFSSKNDFILPPISALVASIPTFHEPPTRKYYQQGITRNVIDALTRNTPNYPPVTATPVSPIRSVITKNFAETVIVKQPTSIPKAPPSPPKSYSDDSTSEDEDAPSPSNSVPIPMIANPNFNYNQLQPIRILAYQTGISKDPSKSWRYRDIKRSLLEKSSTDQLSLIDSDSNHSILRQRLPHKLTLAQFCKRLMLLVFHYVAKDGREPKFWRKKTVRQELVKKILTECEPDFYRCVNVKVAIVLHSYVSAGMTVTAALKRISDEGKMSYE